MRSEDSSVRLSIIVPVYNAEPYLHRCLDSLLCQGVEESALEIICVDDGSTDGSWQVLQHYSLLHDCIKAFSQKNAGVGVARNFGLSQAFGEAVAFCDADDYLIPYGLGYILDTFWNDQVDVICHGSTTLDAKKLRTWKDPNDPSGVAIFSGLGHEVYERSPKYFVWNTIIRRSYLKKNNLHFQPLVMSEDACFLLDLLMSAPKTLDVSCNIYRYTVNEQQVTRRRDPALMRQCIEAYLYFFVRLQYYGQTKVLQWQKKPFYSRVLSAKLNKKEWLKLSNELKRFEFATFPYLLYCSLSILFCSVFVPYILPRLSRG